MKQLRAINLNILGFFDDITNNILIYVYYYLCVSKIICFLLQPSTLQGIISASEDNLYGFELWKCQFFVSAKEFKAN